MMRGAGAISCGQNTPTYRGLATFLEITEDASSDEKPLSLVFEFRRRSWFIDAIYRLLEHYQAALCIADSPRYPREERVTAGFTYLRFHGRKQLLASKYSDTELAAKVSN